MQTKSLEETHVLARDFIQKLVSDTQKKARVIGLIGDLGSGKTTFVQGIAKALGIEVQIQSPTFVIEKRYDIPDSSNPFKKLIHIDAYRLESGNELARLSWKETVSDPSHLVIVEWPERVSEVMPEESLYIKFTFIDENTRQIEFDAEKTNKE